LTYFKLEKKPSLLVQQISYYVTPLLTHIVSASGAILGINKRTK